MPLVEGGWIILNNLKECVQLLDEKEKVSQNESSGMVNQTQNATSNVTSNVSSGNMSEGQNSSDSGK